MTKLVFVRHGIFSSHTAIGIASLANAIGARVPGLIVDNSSYGWQHGVLVNGLKLAGEVTRVAGPDARIVLLGHSQGGLVSRVAAAALIDPDGLRRGIGLEVSPLSLRREARWELDRIGATSPCEALKGVITLATPNDGAITLSQLARAFQVLDPSLKTLTRQALKWPGLDELTSGMVQRCLQHATVPSVRYLTVSGSKNNRFAPYAVSGLMRYVWIGATLALPNDGVVEDRSVDLRQSTHRPEVGQLAQQHEHVRAYIDCTTADHGSILTTPEVENLVVNRLTSWL